MHRWAAFRKWAAFSSQVLKFVREQEKINTAGGQYMMLYYWCGYEQLNLSFENERPPLGAQLLSSERPIGYVPEAK
jgi:hypothetical protein